MEVAPHLALWPGVCLTVVVYSINMFGDAVRDLLDPRLRGRLGRYGKGHRSITSTPTPRFLMPTLRPGRYDAGAGAAPLRSAGPCHRG